MKPSLGIAVLAMALTLALTTGVAHAQRSGYPQPGRAYPLQQRAARAPAPRQPAAHRPAHHQQDWHQAAPAVRQARYQDYAPEELEFAPTEAAGMDEGYYPDDTSASFAGDGFDGYYHDEGPWDQGHGCNTCGGRCPGDCRRLDYQGPINGGWASVDYLLWFGKGTQLPPLVTSSPQTAPMNDWGVLEAPGTQVLFGNERVDNQARSGGRIDAGIWFDAEQDFGLGVNFLAAGRAATAFDVSSNANGLPILGRPFFNEETLANDAQLVSQPGFTRGGVHVQTANTAFGVEAYLREQLWEEPGYRLDLLYGYRMLRIDESVAIYDSTTIIEPNLVLPLGSELYGEDVFNTQNTFQGGQIGVLSRVEGMRWGYDLIFKLALGNIYQTANIRGNNRLSIPDLGSFDRDGSLYALDSNIGRYTRNVFGIVPELGVNVHYRISPSWRVSVGYTFLYINNVQQAARVIDQNVNPTQIDGPLVGPARPAFAFASDSFWLQGVNFGLECRF